MQESRQSKLNVSGTLTYASLLLLTLVAILAAVQSQAGGGDPEGHGNGRPAGVEYIGGDEGGGHGNGRPAGVEYRGGEGQGGPGNGGGNPLGGDYWFPEIENGGSFSDRGGEGHGGPGNGGGNPVGGDYWIPETDNSESVSD